MVRPVKGTNYVYDADEPGLCVRLTPNVATYVFYRWHNGAPGRITLAKVGKITLREARQISAGYRGDLARGIDVFAAVRANRAAPRPVTLTDAYALLVARPGMRPSTLRDYASLWKRVPARMKGRALGEIAPHDVVKLHNEIGAKHPRTANKIIALLSVLFTRNGRRHDNPATDVQRFAEEARQRILTLDELQGIRAALEGEQEPWRSFFLLAMLTGARRGALARMQWADLDLEGAVWRIPAVWSKNRRVLTTALATEAVTILRELRRVKGASDWVFPSKSDGSRHLTEPRKAWGRICKRATISDAHIHDLRRTLGTAVAADGNGAAIVSAVLGHVSQQSSKAYLHLSAEMARGAVEKAAARSRRPADAA
jgi:integrase